VLAAIPIGIFVFPLVWRLKYRKLHPVGTSSLALKEECELRDLILHCVCCVK
jgi:hypothetical protein